VSTTSQAPALALETCARRLAPLGLRFEQDAGGGELICDGGAEVAVGLSWHGTAALPEEGSEATVQALSGLMAIHGRDAGRPRRLGIEAASVTAGMLAAQAAVAAAIGHARGRPSEAVGASALEAALLLASHRIAAATTGVEWVPIPPGPAPGPPFRSAEGHWLELETLDASDWRAFWTRIGAGEADLQRGWRLFRPRYFRGTCTLPPGLHEATAALPLQELAAAARECRVSLTRVREHAEVLADPGFTAGHPDVRELASTGAWGAEARGAQAEPGGLPLAGLRVVESTSRLQGPLAARLLQLLGAHVIKVEPPGGDLSRSIPPEIGEHSAFYLSFNRGKEVVELDLARSQQRAELRELIAGADVFLHNWRPGRDVEWGLDPHRLLAVNPRLVFVEGSGWGQLAAGSGLLGMDFLVQAYSGLACAINADGRPPLPSRMLLSDYMGALSTAEAALHALLRRERSARPQRAGGSLFAGAMALQAHVLEAMAGGGEHGRRRAGRPLWTLLDEPLASADGMLAVGVRDGRDRGRLCRCYEVDARSPAAELRIAERIAASPTADALELIGQAGVPCQAACTDLAALPADPRLAGLFEPLGASARAPIAPWRIRG
jgi:CoA:oxalate CoA-transferase